MQNRYINCYQSEIFAAENKTKNNEKMCDIIHNFNDISCYIASVISLERFYFTPAI